MSTIHKFIAVDEVSSTACTGCVINIWTPLLQFLSKIFQWCKYYTRNINIYMEGECDAEFKALFIIIGMCVHPNGCWLLFRGDDSLSKIFLSNQS